MWEHAGLICFILDAHRSVLPTRLLHPYIRPVNPPAQCVGIVPATTEASVLLSRPALQPTGRLLHVCCVGHPPAATSVYLLLPRGACKHYLSAHALDGNKHGHAISVLLPSLITSITRLRHDTEFSMVVDLLNQVSFQVVPTVGSLVTRPLPTSTFCKVQPSSSILSAWRVIHTAILCTLMR